MEVSIPVKVTIVNRSEHDAYIEDSKRPYPRIYRGIGVYYGNGRLIFTAVVPEGKIEYEIDPECFNEEDPKRCIRVDNNKWSRYRLRSSIVDSRAFLKALKKGEKSCAKI